MLVVALVHHVGVSQVRVVGMVHLHILVLGAVVVAVVELEGLLLRRVVRLLGLLVRLMLLVHQGVETDEVVVLATRFFDHSRGSLGELCELILLFLTVRERGRCHILMSAGGWRGSVEVEIEQVLLGSNDRNLSNGSCFLGLFYCFWLCFDWLRLLFVDIF